MDIHCVTERKKNLLGMALGTGMLLLGGALAPTNRFLPGLLLIACGAALYFWFSLFVAQRNWWDMRAVFSAIWLATIGLSSFRLTDYQTVWAFKTWLCLAAAYAMFMVGAEFGIYWGAKIQQKCSESKKTLFGRFKFAYRPERLFWVCFAVTMVGVASFAANVAIKGYIPYFSSDDSAYFNFYTKFYLFSTAATMISGLSYYTLVTQKLSLWKRIFLVFSIGYATFAYPTLVVSRGTFLTAALSLLTVVFYLHKRKFWVLVLCTAITIGFYGVGTNARGYTEDQMNAFFEPSKIVSTKPTTEPSESTTVPTTVPGTTEQPVEEPVMFQLSGSAAFVYSYLTVSHDNFDLAVKEVQNYTWGVRQLVPFNVILRMSWVDEIVNANPRYLVRPHLNTINIAGDAYYDFGLVGVAVLMLIWAFGFGAVQGWYEKGKGVFSLLALGATMTPVTLCFFSVWLSLFQTWMHWGLVLIMFLASCTTMVKKEN